MLLINWSRLLARVGAARRHLGAIALLGLCAGAALPASATLVTSTYRGYVLALGPQYANPDDANIFHIEGCQLGASCLDNQEFKAVMSFDTDLAPNFYTGADKSIAQGGSDFGLPSFASATITINGYSKTIYGTKVAQFYRSEYGLHEGVIYEGALDYIHFLPTFSPALSPGFGLTGTFVPPQTNAAGATYEGYIGFQNATFARLHINTITYAVGAPVPEPASWALMLGGFGMIGTVLRRRRSAAIATA